MFKIGEFSKLTQVSVRMLRYYDEAGLLKPAQIDRFTGYRLYTAAQIPDLNRVIFLRDLGFGVAEIASALQNWSPETIARALDTKEQETRRSIADAQSRLDQISLARKHLAAQNIAVHYNAVIKEVPACFVLSLRRVVPDYYAEGVLWKKLSAFALKNKIPISQNCFTIYHDTEYIETGVDMELCVPVAQAGSDAGGFTYRWTEAVAHMAFTMVYGPFENIAGAYHAFAAWLEAHNQYQMAGTSRQIVHRGPGNEQDPQNYLTEIQIPLTYK